jgi:hypothetical protein
MKYIFNCDITIDANSLEEAWSIMGEMMFEHGSPKTKSEISVSDFGNPREVKEFMYATPENYDKYIDTGDDTFLSSTKPIAPYYELSEGEEKLIQE